MTYFAMIRVLLEMDWQSSFIRNNQSISTQYAPLLAARADILMHISLENVEKVKSLAHVFTVYHHSQQQLTSLRSWAVLKIPDVQQPGEEPAPFSPFGRSALFQDRRAILSYKIFVK